MQIENNKSEKHNVRIRTIRTRASWSVEFGSTNAI